MKGAMVEIVCEPYSEQPVIGEGSVRLFSRTKKKKKKVLPSVKCAQKCIFLESQIYKQNT